MDKATKKLLQNIENAMMQYYRQMKSEYIKRGIQAAKKKRGRK